MSASTQDHSGLLLSLLQSWPASWANLVEACNPVYVPPPSGPTVDALAADIALDAVVPGGDSIAVDVAVMEPIEVLLQATRDTANTG